MAKKSGKEKEEVKKQEETIKTEETVATEEIIYEEVENSDNNTGENDKLNSDSNDDNEKSSKSKKKSKSHEEDIKELEEKVNDLNDKYLRLSAEFDNYRKRTLKEKMDMTKFASEEVLKDLLPVFDDFERALSNIDSAKDVGAVKEGLLLIDNKFKDFLSRKGLKEIEAKECDFDADFHEAITKIPAPNNDLKGKIVDVIEKGYTLNEKVIRYSKVVIGE